VKITAKHGRDEQETSLAGCIVAEALPPALMRLSSSLRKAHLGSLEKQVLRQNAMSGAVELHGITNVLSTSHREKQKVKENAKSKSQSRNECRRRGVEYDSLLPVGHRLPSCRHHLGSPAVHYTHVCLTWQLITQERERRRGQTDKRRGREVVTVRKKLTAEGYY
jgi:hypothetical protein